jgi:hypothetical protein
MPQWPAEINCSNPGVAKLKETNAQPILAQSSFQKQKGGLLAALLCVDV